MEICEEILIIYILVWYGVFRTVWGKMDGGWRNRVDVGDK